MELVGGSDVAASGVTSGTAAGVTARAPCAPSGWTCGCWLLSALQLWTTPGTASGVGNVVMVVLSCGASIVGARFRWASAVGANA